MQPSAPLVTQVIQKPLFDTTFVNVDYYFNLVLKFVHWLGSLQAGSTIYLVSYILSLFGITLIIYSLVRMVEIYREEHSHLQHAIAEYSARHNEEAAAGKNERWEHIQDLINSPSESNWRLAIIEGDSVLEGLLEARGIPGAGIGERLKNMSPGDLGSIQAAWEAHLVRNRIAHEGSEFTLTQRDARRTIQLYEVVFRELGFV